MEAQAQQGRWPFIGQSDVVDVCRNICERIVELEHAFEAGELSSRLTSGGFEQILGPQLYETYAKLVGSAPGPLHHLRVDVVGALLEQLQNDLLPTQVARSELRMVPECDPSGVESQTDTPERTHIKLVEATLDGISSATLRLDQMLDARFWRIGFTFATVDLCDAFAQALVRSAVGRLSSDLLGLQRILDRFSPQPLKRELKIVGAPRDKSFEHLILDILNEDNRRARVAPLLEDFLEKTDLRVNYPGLERKRGARVQVTSIDVPELHETKLEAIRLAEEFVFLSPLSLAEFVSALQVHSPDSSSFTLAPLWDCLERKPIDVPELASELKCIMLRALKGMPESPLGPLVKVPLPIRQLIRLFVETHAMASTSRLREREGANSSASHRMSVSD